MTACQCPHCNETLNIPDDYAGKLGRCTSCGGAFQAPLAQEPAIALVPQRHRRRLPTRRQAFVTFAIFVGVLVAGGVVFQLSRYFHGSGALPERQAPVDAMRNKPDDWVFFTSKERPEGPGARLTLSGKDGRETDVSIAADAVLISYLPNQTLGAFPSELAISVGDTNRVLLRFALPRMSPEEVAGAILTLDMRKSQLPPAEAFTAYVYRVTGAWDEASVAWRNQPAFDPAPVATFEAAPPPATVKVDITGLVRSWCEGAPNDGLLITASETPAPPEAAANVVQETPPPSPNQQGISVLASEIGSRYSVEALTDFIAAGHFSPVVVDWAWITAHWDKTDFDAVNRLASALARSGVPTWGMYRPRFLASPTVPVQTKEDGSSAFDHGQEIRYTDAKARQWGWSWGCEILKKCPQIAEVIIYNPRNVDESPEAREARRADPDAPLKSVAQFLVEARSEWRSVRPDARLGLVSEDVPEAWRFVVDVIDSAHPFLTVKDDVDIEQDVRAAAQLRDTLGGKLSVCLAKATWGETDRVPAVTLAQLAQAARVAGLSYFWWTFDTLFDSTLYQPEEVARALGLNFADLTRPLDALHHPQPVTAAAAKNGPQDWVYFVSRENREGEHPQLLISCGSRTTVAPAVEDTLLISYLADQAWGSHQQLSISLNDTNRVLLRFDVPAIAPAELTRAELLLDLRQSPMPVKQAFEAGVYRVTAPWAESSTTWQNQPVFDAAPQTRFTVKPEPGMVRVGVTALVRAWCHGTPNMGLLIKITEPLGETPPPSPSPADRAAVADGPVPAFAARVDPQWTSPALPLPPESVNEELLPWPFEAPALRPEERAKARQNVWVINNFPLYQFGDSNAYCHNGLDMVLDNKTPIYAIKDGYVKSTEHGTVIIADTPGSEPSWAWAYTHLGNLRVATGNSVKSGTQIGEVRFDGLPHLHLERIYSKEPYWGKWCYAVMPDRHFTYPDDDPPIIQAPFHFVKNMTNDEFKPDTNGEVTVSGDVDIVAGMREQGLCAHSRENGFGDRLAVAKIQYQIKNVQSGRSQTFGSFDFSRLAVKESPDDLAFNTKVTNVLYKHPRLFESEPANGDKSLTYYIITNCLPDRPPREPSPELAEYSWKTAEANASGTALFPDGEYEVTITAWDFHNHSSEARSRVFVHNNADRNPA